MHVQVGMLKLNMVNIIIFQKTTIQYRRKITQTHRRKAPKHRKKEAQHIEHQVGSTSIDL